MTTGYKLILTQVQAAHAEHHSQRADSPCRQGGLADQSNHRAAAAVASLRPALGMREDSPLDSK